MKMTYVVAILLLLSLHTHAQAPSTAPAQISGKSLDARIGELMEREQVVGLAVAVIEGGKISHVQAYGYRNREQQLALETDTIMYGASLTKAAFAYMVLQLVDEGLLELDRSIADYLEEPLPAYEEYRAFADDDTWRALTPRIILSHRTGLSNLRFLEPDGQPRFHFAPGTHYAYSGEGFWVLQRVLEYGLGLDIREEMRKRVFEPFGLRNTDMQWRDSFAKNLADGYAMDGSFEPHDERSNVSAAGSMDTTIADQAKLWRALFAGEGLSEEMRAEWVRAQFPIRTAQKFPTVQMHDTEMPGGEQIALAAGLGVEVWEGPHGPAFAKGGHNPWTANLVICQSRAERCLVMLANSVRAEIIFPELAQLMLAETAYPWWWVYPALHGTPAAISR
ncbi:MAG: serine hydrolase domain-containing protein [Pseudomonadota bacterium]